MTRKEIVPPTFAIFLLSAVALAYEILLVRLFQIIYWHHFAFMIISLALLGYGISGSLITLARDFCLRHYSLLFFVNLMLFGVGSVVTFISVQQIPFNALEILWDSSQWLRFFLTYLLLSLPFLFVANAIALTLLRFDRKIGQIYGADLIGAGVGAVGVIVMLSLFEPESILRSLAVVGLLAGVPALMLERERLLRAVMLCLAIVLVGLLPDYLLKPKLSEYKGLEQTLLMDGARRIESHSNAMSRVDVVESTRIPVRYAPGLSLQSPSGPPAQLGIFVDGDTMSVIDEAVGMANTGYLAYMSSSLPWFLDRDYERILVLNSGTGSGVVQAAVLGSARIDAIEPDSQLTRLFTETYAGFSGWQAFNNRVAIHETTARAWVAATGQSYDLVILGMPGASTGAGAGVSSFAADYTLTVEAVVDYLSRVEQGGYLLMTLWTDTPPKGNLRLFATLVEAMLETGIENPGSRMAWIRSWNTATLLVKQGELTAGEIAGVRDFTNSRGFDLAWLPGMESAEANRIQLLPKPYFHEAALALLGDNAESFITEYQYDIEPVGDANPYFSDHFRWKSIGEFLALPGQAGIALIDVGYPTLIAALGQAFIAVILLILFPLLFLKKVSQGLGTKVRVVIYFSAIGLAFLFMELSFIEILTLVIGNPVHAVAVTLSVFLVFSGLGSLAVQWLLESKRRDASVILRWSVLAIALIALLYLSFRGQVTEHIMALPESVRTIAAVVFCAPLAFVMGMPFPLGMTMTSRTVPELLPWAWGINGCASVLSAILAVLLAMEIGLDGVMICAAGLYLVVLFVQPVEKII